MMVLGIVFILVGVLVFLESIVSGGSVFDVAIALSTLITGIVFIWASGITKLLTGISNTNSEILQKLMIKQPKSETLKNFNEQGRSETKEEAQFDPGPTRRRAGEKLDEYETLSHSAKEILKELDDREIDLISLNGAITTEPQLPFNDYLFKRVLLYEKELADFVRETKQSEQ